MAQQGIIRRDTLIDAAKGIGILLVIFAHTYKGDVTSLVYYFHMPLFFVLTGCALTYSKSLGIKWKSLFKGLVIPYLAFSLITFVYWLLVESRFRPIHDNAIIPELTGWVGFKWQQFINIFTAINTEDAFIYDVVLWFLPTLFVCRLLYSISSKSKYQIIVVLVLALMGYGIIYGLHRELPWCMELAFVCLPFILFGNRMYGCYKQCINPKLSLILIGGGI